MRFKVGFRFRGEVGLGRGGLVPWKGGYHGGGGGGVAPGARDQICLPPRP